MTKETGDFALCKSAFKEVVNGELLFKHNFKLHINSL